MNNKNNKQKYLEIKNSAFDFMPRDQVSLDVLLNRAKVLSSQHKTTSEQQSSLVKFIQFKLGKHELYGIPFENIKEVMSNFLLTYVPNLPSYVAGIINLRGILITVIDLKILFGIQQESSENREMIVVSNDNMIVGLLTDNIIGSSVYDASSLALPILSQSISPEFILGINEGTTAIINISTILADSNLHLMTKSNVRS